MVRRGVEGWELVAGERRLRAAKIAGLETVPADRGRRGRRESALLALVENLQRRDLHHFEEAAAIAAYLQQSGATQEEAAAALGILPPPRWPTSCGCCGSPPPAGSCWSAASLTERHARCLLRLEDEEERLSPCGTSPIGSSTVAQAEQYIERRLAALQATPAAGRRTFILKDVRLFLNSVDHGLRLIRRRGWIASGRGGHGGRHRADHPHPQAAQCPVNRPPGCYEIVVIFLLLRQNRAWAGRVRPVPQIRPDNRRASWNRRTKP